MAEITPELIAGQYRRIIDEIGSLRDDMRVLTAIVQRLDASQQATNFTLQALTNELRAEHMRVDRLSARLEDASHDD